MRRQFLPWIESRKHELDWGYLSYSMTDLNILEQNQDKIDWDSLSYNKNAIPLLENNLDKVNWTNLSENINAILILEKNQDKVNFSELCLNPNIYIYDYDYYRKRTDLYREELMKKVFHPNRLIYYLEIGYDFADM